MADRQDEVQDRVLSNVVWKSRTQAVNGADRDRRHDEEAQDEQVRKRKYTRSPFFL